MPIYISSKGEQKDTAAMAYPYLKSALNKAIDTNNVANMQALQEEIALRDAQNPENKPAA